MALDMPLFAATDQQYSVGRYWDLETRKLAWSSLCYRHWALFGDN